MANDPWVQATPHRYVVKNVATALLSFFSVAVSAADVRDEQMFAQWSQNHRQQVDAYAGYLNDKGVADVVPLHQLLRTASDWDTQTCRRAKAMPFEVPPPAKWPAAVKTLRLVAELRSKDLLPPFEVVSSYRNKVVEGCADGAGSRHPTAGAFDIVPLETTQLMPIVKRLCDYWWSHGKEASMGLSVYDSKRIHLDTVRYSTWGNDRKYRTSVCRR